MKAGASIRITATWVAETTIVDISWDDGVVASAPNPQGPWAGRFALLAGFGTLDGEWDWDRNQLELELWVPIPGSVPPVRRLIATLWDFALPATNGTVGTGTLRPGIAPVAGLLDFDWEVAAIV